MYKYLVYFDKGTTKHRINLNIDKKIDSFESFKNVEDQLSKNNNGEYCFITNLVLLNG